jgi:predicted amidohydrolase YtcJ
MNRRTLGIPGPEGVQVKIAVDDGPFAARLVIHARQSVKLCAILWALAGYAQEWQNADTVLLNGKIVTVDAGFSTREALAIRDGKILVLGATSEVRKLAGPRTLVIDLQGRTVIPGLIDSHLHAIRAGLSFSTEVNWIGASSLTEALGRIHEAAQTKPPGSWLIVEGGWSEDQFKERRRPKQAELAAAAPDSPIYVQLAYSWVMMTPAALKALQINSDADIPGGGKFELDANGKPTGAITGRPEVIMALFDRLPKPNFEQQVEGTRRFFRELNRLAVTGVVDLQGGNMTPRDYAALFNVWQQGQMTIRVAYSLSPTSLTRGSELAEIQSLTRMLPTGFGDDMLHFNGLGEGITAALYDTNQPIDPGKQQYYLETDKQQYYQILQWAAARGLSVTVHWTRDASVGELLELFERVNRETPIAPLRWTITHLHDASVETLRQMKALGVGGPCRIPCISVANSFGGSTEKQRRGGRHPWRLPGASGS